MYFCPGFILRQNIPDDDTVAGLFSEAMKDCGPCEEEWAQSSVDSAELLPVKYIPGSYSVVPMAVYMPRQIFNEAKALVFLMGKLSSVHFPRLKARTYSSFRWIAYHRM